MVVTLAPLACPTSTVQDLTARPSICTTQAPHWLVSQPTSAPVKFRRSRSQVTRSRLSSTRYREGRSSTGGRRPPAPTGPTPATTGGAEYPDAPGPLSPPFGFTSAFLRVSSRPEFTASSPFYFTFARAGSGASALAPA